MFSLIFLLIVCFIGVTIFEQFTFCFNTILGDIAAHFSHVRDKVIAAQVSLMEKLTQEIIFFGNESNNTNRILSEDCNLIDSKGFFVILDVFNKFIYS